LFEFLATKSTQKSKTPREKKKKEKEKRAQARGVPPWIIARFGNGELSIRLGPDSASGSVSGLVGRLSRIEQAWTRPSLRQA
jgi:hypothetical protein